MSAATLSWWLSMCITDKPVFLWDRCPCSVLSVLLVDIMIIWLNIKDFSCFPVDLPFCGKMYYNSNLAQSKHLRCDSTPTLGLLLTPRQTGLSPVLMVQLTLYATTPCVWAAYHTFNHESLKVSVNTDRLSLSFVKVNHSHLLRSTWSLNNQ